MAHDIKIAGATYNGVPAVVLKDTAGGNVRYTDTSDATAAAGDIAAGKTAYGADGTKITGTSSGGGGGGGDTEEIKKWLYGDEAYMGSLTTYPDFILNAASLNSYACAGFFPMDGTDLIFPNLKAVPSSLFGGNFYIKSFTGPSVTKLKANALSNLSSIEAVNIPKVITIGTNAFVNCSALRKVNFPLCKTIMSNALEFCSNLSKADVGLAEEISAYAFSYCNKLTTLILRGDKVCTLDDANALGYERWDKSTPLAKMTGSIYVPDSLVDSYKKATNWSIFASIIKPLSAYTG